MKNGHLTDGKSAVELAHEAALEERRSWRRVEGLSEEHRRVLERHEEAREAAAAGAAPVPGAGCRQCGGGMEVRRVLSYGEAGAVFGVLLMVAGGTGLAAGTWAVVQGTLGRSDAAAMLGAILAVGSGMVLAGGVALAGSKQLTACRECGAVGAEVVGEGVKKK